MERPTSFDYQKFEERWEKERRIDCPFCGTTQSQDDNRYPCTYWGDEDLTEMECEECGKTFWVKEIVSRTYAVGKTYEEANDR